MVTSRNFEIFGPPNNFWRKGAVCLKFGTGMEDGPFLRTEYKSAPKWAWPGSRDRISKLWDAPNHFWTKRATRLKFGKDIDDRPCLLTDYKTTPKCAWPGSRDLISKFWDPHNNLITFERIEQSATSLVQRFFWKVLNEKYYPLEIWYRHCRGRTLPAYGS